MVRTLTFLTTRPRTHNMSVKSATVVVEFFIWIYTTFYAFSMHQLVYKQIARGRCILSYPNNQQSPIYTVDNAPKSQANVRHEWLSIGDPGSNTCWSSIPVRSEALRLKMLSCFQMWLSKSPCLSHPSNTKENNYVDNQPRGISITPAHEQRYTIWQPLGNVYQIS